MGYCKARIIHDQQEFTYRAYLTDALMIISDNTRRFAGGRALTKRYADVAAPRRVDNRTGDEIAFSVIKKLQKAGITITN